jgi:peptide/nickel transport system permease protein
MTTKDANSPTLAQLDHLAESRSFWDDARRSILHDRLTLLALGMLLLMTLGCIFAPPVVEDLTGLDANRTLVLDRYLGLGEKGHILGTDQLGRDQLIRLLYGGRVSLSIAYFASVLSITIGVILGIISGYYGGIIDDFIMWFINTLAAIPALFLLILVASIWSSSAQTLVLILGALGWINSCRLVRGEVMALKERDYILAARALGASTPHLAVHYIFPNILPLIIVALTINAGTLILIEAGLSFLGLGVQPPAPSWGNMLTASRTYFMTAPHLVVWPGILITITVLCFYLVGDGLRDALDPRMRRA